MAKQYRQAKVPINLMHNPILEQTMLGMGVTALRLSMEQLPDASKAKESFIRTTIARIRSSVDQQMTDHIGRIAADPLMYLFDPGQKSARELRKGVDADIEKTEKFLRTALFQ